MQGTGQRERKTERKGMGGNALERDRCHASLLLVKIQRAVLHTPMHEGIMARETETLAPQGFAPQTQGRSLLAIRARLARTIYVSSVHRSPSCLGES